MKQTTIKQYIYIVFLSVFIASGCEKSENSPLEKQFRGTYEIVSAMATTEVDVDLDGTGHRNMLTEIQNLKNSYLELIVGSFQTYVFSQFWQNQYFLGVEGTPISYDPSIVVDYMNQATVANFRFDDKLKTFVLSRSNDEPAFPLPESMKLIQDNLIKVTMSKRLFTRSGWETVKIDVVYKKIWSPT